MPAPLPAGKPRLQIGPDFRCDQSAQGGSDQFARAAMSESTVQTAPEHSLREVSRPRRFGGLRAIFALSLREMSTTYGRTTGGYLWAILEPVAGIALLTLVFSLIQQNPMLGTNFQIFYASGLVPFMFYTDVSVKISHALFFSRALLFYPAVTFVDSLIARTLVNVTSQLLIGFLILGGILLIMETRTDPQIDQIALAYAMVTVLSIGIGTLNCFLFAWFPVWQKIWGVVNRPMFIISGIFFTYESIPLPYREYLWYNPLIHISGQMRHGFYRNYAADFVSPIYVFGIGAGCFVVGMALLMRYNRDILNER